MYRSAKARAKALGLPFNLKMVDIEIPTTCPVLDIPLHSAESHQTDNSPSLDRIVPSKGYVKENVVVVSMRVNRIKSDATVAELELMTKFYKRYAAASVN